MTFAEALDIAVARTGWPHYRTLCGPSHPGHEAYRAVVMEIAAGPEPVPTPRTPEPDWPDLPPVPPRAGGCCGGGAA